ncbi:MAG TPA: DUF1631 family protein, partial [Xanthomonadales bacterium]|nr:DUF1631 family protein [Xanthomonadales bacterium]
VDACRGLLDAVRSAIDAGAASAPDAANELPPELAAAQLRALGPTIEDEFRRRLTQPWRTPMAGDSAPRRDAAALQLVGNGEMRAWLTGREASRALGRVCDPAWRPLRALLEFALRGRAQSNPDALGVTAVVDALAHALSVAGLDAGLQDLILHAAGQPQSLDLAGRYERLWLALRRAGIQTESAANKAAAKQSTVAAPAPSEPAGTASAGASSKAASTQPAAAPPMIGFAAPDPASAWSALRRIGTAVAPGVDPNLLAGGGAVADAVLLRAAGELLGARDGTTATEFRARLQQRARHLAGDAGAPLEQRQHDAVDLVARIHEALDEDPLLPAGFRERCRPLLRPILAAELQGEGIGEAGAPLRRLLSLVEFGSALFASRQDPMTNKLRDTLDDELATLTRTQPWSKPQLEASCERLEALLQRHRAASQAGEKRVVDACEGQQRIADARAHVQRELSELFADSKLPPGLIETLARQLASTMLPLLLRAGPEAAQWQEMLGRLQQLQAALQRAPGAPANGDSARHLEWLHQTCAGSSDEAALGRCLDGIEAALQGKPVSWPAEQGSGEPLSAATGAPMGSERRLATLQLGDWLSLEDPGQPARLLKLAWRASDASRFVLVNRLGQKAEEIDGAALQAKLDSGSARMVEQGDADLAERAWRRMLIGRHNDLAVQATRDPLTGLLDRRELERHLHAWLVATERAPMLLLWIGIDHLRLVNQSHGMAAGDHLLCEVAATLQRYLQDSRDCQGIVARVAGDEFVVVLQGLPAAQAERIAVAMFDQASALDLNYEGNRLRLSLSMGMVPVDAASASIERLLADAERACDAAKESGRGRWYRYQSDDALLSQMRESADWVRRLDESLQSRGLLLYGQRAVWLGSTGERKPDYIEVLLRMRTSDGVASPGEFIIAAERYGQIAAVDRYVLQELARQLQQVGSVGNLRIAFNISARNIIDAAFVDEIIEILRQQPVPLQQLCVELTETAAIQQIEDAGVGMRKLAAAGLSLVLDDFGSGWSSYQYLRRLPFDVVKVDGAFIRDITRTAEDRALASSINEIAHLLGKQTVAEHVEDQATLDAVRAIGFDYAQGYLIGKPVPLSELLGT